MTDEGSNHPEFSVETYDISSLKEITRRGDEAIYNCPLCIDKRGKADTDGKFYFNVRKQKGYCFKCHSSIYPEGENDQRFDRSEVEWKKSIDALLRHYPDTIFDGMEIPEQIPFEFQELTPDLLTYLERRNPFLPFLKDCLGFHAWKGRDTGVVIPFFYRGAICKFQCRFVTRKGRPLEKNDKMKYYTSPGPKPLYSPFHIFDDFKTASGIDQITICEGVFDAIALAIMKFPNPVAVLGDRLTPLHLYDIRHLMPIVTKVYLCLDDIGRSKSIERVVKKFLPCVEETEVFSAWGENKDPEKFMVEYLAKSDEFREDCTDMAHQWINAWQGGVNSEHNDLSEMA